MRALATLSLLLEQSYRSLVADFEVVDFFQAGLFSAGFFAVAISARLLASRVIANERIGAQAWVDLKNQTLISQRVIEEMQDGVLVLGRMDGSSSTIRAPFNCSVWVILRSASSLNIRPNWRAYFQTGVSIPPRFLCWSGTGQWHAVAGTICFNGQLGSRRAGFPRGHGGLAGSGKATQAGSAWTFDCEYCA